MRLLFEMDEKDYEPDGQVLLRPSARGIIIQTGKIAMVRSLKYAYYKFPGGGIEAGENRIQALIRETAEEAGLCIVPQTIRPYGRIRRMQKGERGGVFIQDNFYYLCHAENASLPQRLDDYEAEERFTLEWIDPKQAIAANRSGDHGPKDQKMLEREARVLEALIKESYFL